MALSDWQKPKYVPLFESDGETETEYRLAFKVLSQLDASRMSRKRFALAKELADEYGDYKELSQDDKDDYTVIFTQIIQLCGIDASLASVEVKDGDKWKAAELPATWRDIGKFARTAPAGLIDDLFDGVLAAGNPKRLFSLIPATEDEEKKIQIFVPKSES